MLIRHQVNPMIRPAAKTMTLVAGVGFSHPILRDGVHSRRYRAVAGLITTLALVVSLAIAVAAVSIGIARADSPANALGAHTEVCCVQ